MAHARKSSHLLLVTLALYLNSCTSATAPDEVVTSPEPDERGSPDKILLNSERIENKFGSYAIEILAALDSYRLANLYSVQDDVKTTRTLALVKFASSIPEEMTLLHNQILDGASIGATFKNAGWHVQKDPLRYDTLSVDPSNATVYDYMQLDDGQPLAMQVYAFSVSKHQQVHYADIVEIYHPEYLQRDDLPASGDLASANAVLSQQTIRTMLSELLPASTD